MALTQLDNKTLPTSAEVESLFKASGCGWENDYEFDIRTLDIDLETRDQKTGKYTRIISIPSGFTFHGVFANAVNFLDGTCTTYRIGGLDNRVFSVFGRGLVTPGCSITLERTSRVDHGVLELEFNIPFSNDAAPRFQFTVSSPVAANYGCVFKLQSIRYFVIFAKNVRKEREEAEEAEKKAMEEAEKNAKIMEEEHKALTAAVTAANEALRSETTPAGFVKVPAAGAVTTGEEEKRGISSEALLKHLVEKEKIATIFYDKIPFVFMHLTWDAKTDHFNDRGLTRFAVIKEGKDDLFSSFSGCTIDVGANDVLTVRYHEEDPLATRTRIIVGNSHADIGYLRK